MLKQPLTMHGVRKKLRLFSKENAQPCVDQPTIYDTEDTFTIQLIQKRLSFKNLKPLTLSAQGMMDVVI